MQCIISVISSNTYSYFSLLFIDIELNDVKEDHWMWWGFPQERGSWGKKSVSEQTKIYSIEIHEAEEFLNNEKLSCFLAKGLRLLKEKAEGKSNSRMPPAKIICKYFSAIDDVKFRSHVNLFYYVATSVYDSIDKRIIKLIKRLILINIYYSLYYLIITIFK